MKQTILYFLFLVFCYSCSTQKNLIDPSDQSLETSDDEIYTSEELNDSEEEYTEERTLDELVVTAPRGYKLPVYNAAADRPWDLIHMDLDVRFDWNKERVFGRADLKLAPYFYDQEQLVLDAKGFEIQYIADASGQSLNYEYDDFKLEINLGKKYKRTDELNITIDYVAKPSEGPIGGSAAITSDKGLFFINPRGEEGSKPKQIWTQGETEHNSRWFPTIDKPNERMTHTISLTVDDSFITLSNGEKISSKKHVDGSRTDTWKMDQPHAPYLTMLAVGEFAKVEEVVDGLLLEYYVEPEYEAFAKDIFAHTPEMIKYFSELLDYPYPWNKFSQIITKDYVSGAMENTTAVIYGDFIQKTKRELIDDGNDYIVAHELFHHWFGDLVTVESWANLTLQEGFANYSEHLWQEYKYGLDAAGFQRNNEKQGYLASIMQSGTHPLIHYGYGDKEEMFDGHSYNKGGLVLHMLRHHLGDDAFFSGLNKYLTDHKETAVEVDELRMSFEDVSGLDLQWFFDQWYHAAGHPILDLDYNYNSIKKDLEIKIDQTQNTESAKAIFQLPVTISVYNNAGVEVQYDIFVDERSEMISLPMDNEPALVVFDRYDHLLMVKDEKKSTEEYINQYNWVDTYIHRVEAINKIKKKKEAQPTLLSALADNHHVIRKAAVENIKVKDDIALIERLKKMAKADPHSSVRGAAIKKLNKVSGVDIVGIIEDALATEQSYKVISDALETLDRADSEAAVIEAVKMKSEKTSQLTGAVSAILAKTGDVSHLPYFEERLTSVSFYSAFSFYDSYYELLSQLDTPTLMSKVSILHEIALSPVENIFYKYTSTNVLNSLRSDLLKENPEAAKTISGLIEEIKEQENNPLLQQRYGAF